MVQPNLPIVIYHLIRLTFRRLLLFGVNTSIPSTPVRGTFTPVYAPGAGGTVNPGGMKIPIGVMSLSSRYETPRSAVLSLADEEEGDVMVEEKNSLDAVNRKTREQDSCRRGLGSLEKKKEKERDIEGGCRCRCVRMNLNFGRSILIFSLVYFSYVK